MACARSPRAALGNEVVREAAAVAQHLADSSSSRRRRGPAGATPAPAPPVRRPGPACDRRAAHDLGRQRAPGATAAAGSASARCRPAARRPPPRACRAIGTSAAPPCVDHAALMVSGAGTSGFAGAARFSACVPLPPTPGRPSESSSASIVLASQRPQRQRRGPCRVKTVGRQQRALCPSPSPSGRRASTQPTLSHPASACSSSTPRRIGVLEVVEGAGTQPLACRRHQQGLDGLPAERGRSRASAAPPGRAPAERRPWPARCASLAPRRAAAATRAANVPPARTVPCRRRHARRPTAPPWWQTKTAQRGDQPRLAQARLARQQHDPAV